MSLLYVLIETALERLRDARENNEAGNCNEVTNLVTW